MDESGGGEKSGSIKLKILNSIVHLISPYCSNLEGLRGMAKGWETLSESS